MDTGSTRRRWVAAASLAGPVAALAQVTPRGAEKQAADAVTSATEDLMVEHGVLRRCLAVYGEAAARLRTGGGPVPLDALRDAITIFQAFGERMHERRQEEEIVFPQYAALDDASRITAEVLAFQHRRGREINAWLLQRIARPLSGEEARAAAGVLDGFVRMYVYHAALEDTMVYPRWKSSRAPDALREAARRFERIEAEEIGRDGLEDVLRRLGRIDRAFQVGQLSLWTAPGPPDSVR